MKNRTGMIVMALTLFFILGLAPNQGVGLDISRAPDFTLPDLQSNSITLSSFKGQSSVILFFWATWCPHCTNQVSTLNTVYNDLLHKNIKLFAIDIEEDKAKVEKFVKEKMLAYPVLLDRDGKVSDKYGIVGIPTFVGINKDGAIKFKKNFLPQDYLKQLE